MFISADDGAVEALLCLDELSVDVVFVVLEEPLPRFVFRSAKMLSSRLAVSGTTDVLGAKEFLAANLAPPSNPEGCFAAPISDRSNTRKDGPAIWALSRLSAVDFRLPKATGNLGI